MLENDIREIEIQEELVLRQDYRVQRLLRDTHHCPIPRPYKIEMIEIHRDMLLPQERETEKKHGTWSFQPRALLVCVSPHSLIR